MSVVEFLNGFSDVQRRLSVDQIERVRDELIALKQRGGRLFFLGVGGSAANASHAVNDFRKICQMECYTPTDNVAELTARTNDDGWRMTFRDWLTVSDLGPDDAIFVLSVGGGSDTTSPNLVEAIEKAREQDSVILGIVGRDGGETLRHADACVLVPTVDESRITPYVESLQVVLLHLLATDSGLAGA